MKNEYRYYAVIFISIFGITWIIDGFVGFFICVGMIVIAGLFHVIWNSMMLSRGIK